MKKIIFIFALLGMLLTVYGAGVKENSINIIVDSQGNSLIEEIYFVSFSDQNELDLFKQKIQDNITTEILQDFNLNIAPRIEETEFVISFEEQAEDKRIKLNYSSDSVFTINEKITFNEFVLNQQNFSFLESENKIVFPENFSLRLVLPKGAEINEEIIPETKVLSKTVEWKGLITTNEIKLSYSIQKKPDPIAIKETIIEINVQENGFGIISEKYLFEFKNQDELQYFVGMQQKNGSSLLSWITFDERIFPHIGENDLDTKNASVEFVENGLTNSFLSITYENESPVFIEEKERTGRFVEWVFNSKKLNSFISGGVIILPENTVIEISFPLNAEIKESDLEVKNGKISWEGYKTTSKINIVYLIKENIAPTFNLSSMIQGFVSNRDLVLGLIAVIIFISVISYFKRDSLTEKIEGFIIKNSEIDAGEETEIEISD